MSGDGAGNSFVGVHFIPHRNEQGSCCSLNTFEDIVVEVSVLAMLLLVWLSLRTCTIKVAAAPFLRG